MENESNEKEEELRSFGDLMQEAGNGRLFIAFLLLTLYLLTPVTLRIFRVIDRWSMLMLYLPAVIIVIAIYLKILRKNN